MLDIVNNPEYGFPEEKKPWARKQYQRLEQHLGEFISLETIDDLDVLRFDTVYPFPRNVAILVNHQNASTDEQFLLAAKQSRKVKIFGTSTFGSLDFSNMYFVPSPCNEFKLGYCISKSLRVPEMAIDGRGIQPDYYIDKTIPTYKWIAFVYETLRQ
jgi:C-terminal processing protease CtpA/Prc